MDPIKCDSIYSKLSQDDINRLKTLDLDISRYAYESIKKVEEIRDDFFIKYFNNPNVRYFGREDYEYVAKQFKMTYEKFPINKEIWDAYKLEHVEQGLCAYFFYKIEEYKILYKRIDLLYI